MRSVVAIFLLTLAFGGYNAQQGIDSIIRHSTSMLRELKEGDSLVYYQCHVESGVQQLSTASGQQFKTRPHQITITEKLVVKLKQGQYHAEQFVSYETMLPNRRFSGLKIREKDYWNFSHVRNFQLTERDIRTLMALEKKGHEAIEFDYAITKSNTNQLIIRQRKNFMQLVMPADLVMTKLIGQ